MKPRRYAEPHQRQVKSSNTRAPSGDFAFASAVAAFGQKLRGDSMLADYSYSQVADLAGDQRDFWRQEFVQLVKTADGLE